MSSNVALKKLSVIKVFSRPLQLDGSNMPLGFAHRGALIVNIHLLRVLTEERNDVFYGVFSPHIPLPDLNDLTFYNQCFLIGINAQASEKLIQRS